MTLDPILGLLDDELARIAAEQEALTVRAEKVHAARAEIAGLFDAPQPPPAAASKSPVPTAKRRKSPGKGGPVDCPDCGKTMKTPGGLGPHRRACPGPVMPLGARRPPRVPPNYPPGIILDPVDGAVFTCRGCHKSFLTEKRHQNHERFCADLDHRCPICGETFLTPGNLSAHRHREDHYTPEERAVEEGEAA